MKQYLFLKHNSYNTDKEDDSIRWDVAVTRENLVPVYRGNAVKTTTGAIIQFQKNSHFLPLHTQTFAITYDLNNKIFGLVRQTRLYPIRKDRYWTDQPTYFSARNYSNDLGSLASSTHKLE